MSSKQSITAVIVLVVVILVIVGLSSGSKEVPDATDRTSAEIINIENNQENMQETSYDHESLKEHVTHTVTLKTNEGDIVIDLYGGLTPKTVENFVKLSSEGFYDGVRFHRVISGFMIQAGDPLSKDLEMQDRWGTGGPGYTFEDEFAPELRHSAAGILSMANAGPGTNGSQFFITLDQTPHLNDRHSVFGYVTEGMDVVDTIGITPTEGPDRPIDEVVINEVAIEEKGSELE